MTIFKNMVCSFLALVMVLTISTGALAGSPQSKFYSDDQFVTPEMAERDREAFEQMVEEGEIIAHTRARKVLSVTHLFQNPNPSKGDIGDWKNTMMPCGDGTYGAIGCAITSYAMMARYFGITSLNTPPKFGTAYHKEYNDPCNQMADLAADLMGKRAITTRNPTQQQVINFCIASINQNKLVILRTNKNNGHYVLANGYDGNTIMIRDPERGYNRTTLQQYFADSQVTHMASIG